MGAAVAASSAEPPGDAGEEQAPTYQPEMLVAGERDPQTGHPEVLAIDVVGGRVFLRKSDGDHHRVEIVSMALGTRREVESWQNDDRHPIEAFGFARLAFQPMTSDRSADLVALGAIAAHAEGRTLAVPTISVSRDRARIAYLVRAQPTLQVAVADGAGQHERRIGTARMRGRDPSLSPDGRWVAFSACAPDATSNDCARSLYVADLESPRPTPRKVDSPWPSLPSWDADSRGLWVTREIARERATVHVEQGRSCLQHVDVVQGHVEEVVCADGAYDTDYGVAPDGRKAVFVAARGEPPSLRNTLRVCDLGSRHCDEERAIPQLVGPPLLTDDGYVVSAGYLGLPWALHVATWQHGTLRRNGWHGRAVRAGGPHGFAWLEVGSFAPAKEGERDRPAFAVWGLDASELIHAGPPATP